MQTLAEMEKGENDRSKQANFHNFDKDTIIFLFLFFIVLSVVLNIHTTVILSIKKTFHYCHIFILHVIPTNSYDFVDFCDLLSLLLVFIRN